MRAARGLAGAVAALPLLLASTVLAEPWGNVLDTETPLPTGPVASEAITRHALLPSVLQYAGAEVNEKLAGCRECSHLSRPEIVAVLSASQQIVVFTENGKSPKEVVMRHWNGTTQQEPLVLGTMYKLHLEVSAHFPDFKTDAESRVASALGTTRHVVHLWGDREGLFSVVRHTWAPVDSKFRPPSPSEHTATMKAWFNMERQGEDDPLHIICYNIWNFNNPWPARLGLLSDIILESPHPPAILAFQEVRYDNAGPQLGPEMTRHQLDHLLWRLEHKGPYQSVWHPAMSYTQLDQGLAFQTEGPAILTKYPVVKVDHIRMTRFWPKDRGDEHQRLCLAVTIDTPQLGRINVLTTHLSLSDSARMHNVLEICRFASKLEQSEDGGKATLLMGDLNMIPSDKAMKFLTGEIEFEGERCSFKDVWFHAKHRTHDVPEALKDGLTFNNLDAKLAKRIDFVLAKGDIDPSIFSSMAIIGSRKKQKSKVPPSDHMGIRLMVEKAQPADDEL